jgi:predicted nucleotidyltransferase
LTVARLGLRRLLECLAEAEIEFVLVGGLAVNAWGYMRATRDIDLVPDPSTERAIEVDMDGLIVRVCSLEHLLEMKRASDRPRDREDLEMLEAGRDRT